ncbi:acyltransferase family protein [Intrasporangium flavum]|uniref:acyltransferase family protein n=1 Tax=Intrasporangium flavum TaxID=1428657 RepID=UPI00096E6A41|nr:acyltransferase [Intrasporangium flavum]
MHYLRSLTGLRSVAALLVLLHHVAVLRPDIGLLRPAELGYVGVTFFFVLSGFVLTYSWNDAMTARDFYVKRLARIYPLHLATIALMLVIDRGEQPLSAVVANASLVHAWWPQQWMAYSVVGAAWSLSCEAFFYALFPFAIGAVAVVRRPLLQASLLASAVVAIAALTASKTGVGSYFFHLPMVRFSDFLIGILLCLSLRRGWRPPGGVKAMLLVLCGGYSVLSWVQHEQFNGTDRQWFYSAVLALPFGLLIAACAVRDLDGRPFVLATRIWVRLGEWSFALYLVHGPVLSVLRAPLTTSEGTDAVLAILSVLFVSLAAAALLHELVEAPLERAIRRAWTRRRPVRVEPGASAALG